MRGAGIEVTQNYTKKPEMPPITFVGILCKIRAVLCSKIADVQDVRSWKLVYFRKIFRFLLHNTRDVTRGARSTILWAPNYCGRPKSTNNDISTFFKTVHLFPKDLRFEQRVGKLTSCPRCHLTLLRPSCTMHITIV